MTDTPETTRLIRVAGDLLEWFGTRTDDGRRIRFVSWGEPDADGAYTPTLASEDDGWVERIRSESRATERQRVEALEEALRDAHKRLEAFEPPNGRGLLLPGAYALDHEAGSYPNCDYCAALTATEPETGE